MEKVASVPSDYTQKIFNKMEYLCWMNGGERPLFWIWSPPMVAYFCLKSASEGKRIFHNDMESCAGGS